MRGLLLRVEEIVVVGEVRVCCRWVWVFAHSSTLSSLIGLLFERT